MRTQVDRLLRMFSHPTPDAVRGWAVASIVANIVIVLTGAAVRLTGSGLGCPTWPRCTSTSFVPHRELGMHGAIEFGNRLLTYVLIAVAIGTWVVVMRSTRTGDRARLLATVMAVGIPAQGVIGGITVLTDLNPWIVALHLVLSLALVAASVVLLTWVSPPPVGGRAYQAPRPVVALLAGTYATMWAVVYVGTIVTGSGPHAGDSDAPRNGLDPAALSQLHADLVFVLIGLSVGTVAVLHTAAAPSVLLRTAYLLVGVELAQGLIGLVQFATELPIVLVWFHLLGASVLVAVATRLLAVTGATARAAIPAAPEPATH